VFIGKPIYILPKYASSNMIPGVSLGKIIVRNPIEGLA
jgi:hypothetical protein